MRRRGFDIVVFVATKGELEAILKWTSGTGGARWETGHDRNGNVIRVLLVRTSTDRILRLALQALPKMGAEACVYYVSTFLRQHPCTLVAMVGICAGESKNKVKMGDIVIPGQVASICNGKQTGRNQVEPGNRYHTLKDNIQRELSQFESSRWTVVAGEIGTRGLDICGRHLVPRLHFEEKIVMAQVSHVMAFSDSFEELRAFAANRNVLALEMESAALAYAVEKVTDDKGLWLTVKGVQDHADAKKNHRLRPFCSWASFHTLQRFLEYQLAECWRSKPQIRSHGAAEDSDSDTQEMTSQYRQGNFHAAQRAGQRAFKAAPKAPSIWHFYLSTLLRIGQHAIAADMIDIADYEIQIRSFDTAELDKQQVTRYLVRKAEYFFRVGHLKDARQVVQGILDSCGEDVEMRSSKAEAIYLRGRIALWEYYENADPQRLAEAGNDFSEATELAASKYWAAVAWLMTVHLQDSAKPLPLTLIVSTETRLREEIAAYPHRPAPRIYRLRLLAVQVAAREKKFEELQAEIEREAHECRNKLVLPDDFFRDFESDCRLLFDSPSRRYEQDMLLSLIYHWASIVRKRDPALPRNSHSGRPDAGSAS
jgi:purine-nucleoside phosphorylase